MPYREPTPGEAAALQKLYEAWNELRKYGWIDPLYKCAARDVEIIELGSTGIHIGVQELYEGDGQPGRAWIMDGDAWPSRPLMIREVKKMRKGGKG